MIQLQLERHDSNQWDSKWKTNKKFALETYLRKLNHGIRFSDDECILCASAWVVVPMVVVVPRNNQQQLKKWKQSANHTYFQRQLVNKNRKKET